VREKCTGKSALSDKLGAAVGSVAKRNQEEEKKNKKGAQGRPSRRKYMITTSSTTSEGNRPGASEHELGRNKKVS